MTAEAFDPRAVIREGWRSGLPLSLQHLHILEVLVFRKERHKGPASYELLATAVDAKTANPSRWAQTRMPPLCKALEPFGIGVANVRNIGYELYERV